MFTCLSTQVVSSSVSTRDSKYDLTNKLDQTDLRGGCWHNECRSLPCLNDKLLTSVICESLQTTRSPRVPANHIKWRTIYCILSLQPLIFCVSANHQQPTIPWLKVANCPHFPGYKSVSFYPQLFQKDIYLTANYLISDVILTVCMHQYLPAIYNLAPCGCVNFKDMR